MFLLLVLLAAARVVENAGEWYDRVIYIDPLHGKNNSECLTSNSSSHPCRDLDFVFQAPDYSHLSHTKYVLSPGTHSLTQPPSPFQNLTHLTFVGSNTSVIHCTRLDTGFAFIDVSHIAFYGLSFHSCGTLRNSTSRKYYDPLMNDLVLYTSYVALYFLQCRDVTMDRVTVQHSVQGVVMYNTVGTNVVTNSHFVANRADNSDSRLHPGGGGFYVEFTYCKPGNTKCTDDCMDESIAEFNKNSYYLFDSVNFSGNAAGNLNSSAIEDVYTIPNKRMHDSFGKGGGLAVVFKGNASSNRVEVVDCNFTRNGAEWGGGMLVEYQDYVTNNTVEVLRCLFRSNQVMRMRRYLTAGGAIRLGHYVYSTGDVLDYVRNGFFVKDCNISDNKALSGGGISIFPSRLRTTSQDHQLRMEISDTHFVQNYAQVGAALEVTLFSLFTDGLFPQLVISNSTFSSNKVVDYTTVNRTIQEIGVGTVYSNGVPIRFMNKILFEKNVGSALAVVGTLVNFTFSTVHFLSNSGRLGGGINLLGSAYILVNNSSSLNFTKNHAEIHGGAIANNFIERENFKIYPNCFVRHTDPFKPARHWNAVFQFRDNTAEFLGQSIYTTSINPCLWAGGSGNHSSKHILCWKKWSYYRNGSHSDCHKEIATSCGNILTSPANSKLVIETAPGQSFKIPIAIMDDLNSSITGKTTFSAHVKQSNTSQVNPKFAYTSGNDLQVDGLEGQNVTIVLDTINERSWQVQVVVKLKNCPPGFVLTPTDSTDKKSRCMCDTHNYRGTVQCNNMVSEAFVKHGYWFGQTDDSEGQYVSSLCLGIFCSSGKVKLPKDAADLEEKMCGEMLRKGVLCGECADGYGVSVNSEMFSCVSCNDTTVTTNIIIYVSSVYLPLLVLFLILMLFGVRLTSGNANAFIFYAQAVSSTFNLNADGHILANLSKQRVKVVKWYQIIYGFFNLDFVEHLFKNFCVSPKFNTLDVLQLDYLVALFPIFMIIGVVVIVKIKNSCFCGKISGCCFCRRSRVEMFLRHWKTKSLLHVFSAFLLLSYAKFSLTSSYIVNLHPLYNSQGVRTGQYRSYYAGQYKSNDWQYLLRYYIPGWLVIILLCLLSAVLFSYPVIWFEKYLIGKSKCLRRHYPADKIQIFLDTFQGCYKNDRRCFAGMYFLFRLVINLNYIITWNWFQQYMYQQVICTVLIFLVAFLWPYREEFWYLNYVDLAMFTNLAMVNAVSLYMLAEPQIHGTNGEVSTYLFSFQYVLTIQPLLYMALFVLWTLLPVNLKKVLKKALMHLLKKWRSWRKNGSWTSRDDHHCVDVYDHVVEAPLPKQGPLSPVPRAEITRTEVFLSPSMDFISSNELNFSSSGSNDESMDTIFTRAKARNTYRSITASSGDRQCCRLSDAASGEMRNASPSSSYSQQPPIRSVASASIHSSYKSSKTYGAL